MSTGYYLEEDDEGETPCQGEAVQTQVVTLKPQALGGALLSGLPAGPSHAGAGDVCVLSVRSCDGSPLSDLHLTAVANGNQVQLFHMKRESGSLAVREEGVPSSAPQAGGATCSKIEMAAGTSEATVLAEASEGTSTASVDGASAAGAFAAGVARIDFAAALQHKQHRDRAVFYLRSTQANTHFVAHVVGSSVESGPLIVTTRENLSIDNLREMLGAAPASE